MDNEIVMTCPKFDKFGLSDELEGDNIQNLKESIFNLIRSADNEILICSPFLELKGLDDLVDLLVIKAKNKVKIKILVREVKKYLNIEYGDEIFDNMKIKNAKLFVKLLKKFEELDLKEYISIKDYHYSDNNRLSSGIHSKFIVVDFSNIYLGSADIRVNSFEKNLELGLIFKDSDSNRFRKIFNYLWTVSEDLK